MSKLGLAVKAYHLPKSGSTAEQYEDAWAAEERRGRIAVADGATDSYASGRFARLLVEGFVGESGPRSAEEFGPWAADAAAAWRAATPLDGLPWYKQEKARLGAHSTFLGLELSLGGGSGGSPSFEEEAFQSDGLVSGLGARLDSDAVPSYRAFVVGDACLFHVRGGGLLRSIPIDDPEKLGNQPALIATDRGYSGPGLDTLTEHRGDLVAGDTLVLATDAVAHWFLTAAERGEKPWRTVEDATDAEFSALVGGLRDRGEMRNDDVTVVVAEVVEAGVPGAREPQDAELQETPSESVEPAEPEPVEASAGGSLVGAVGNGETSRRLGRIGAAAASLVVLLALVVLAALLLRSRSAHSRAIALEVCR